jgi:hypothetical protein
MSLETASACSAALAAIKEKAKLERTAQISFKLLLHKRLLYVDSRLLPHKMLRHCKGRIDGIRAYRNDGARDCFGKGRIDGIRAYRNVRDCFAQYAHNGGARGAHHWNVSGNIRNIEKKGEP